jgi:small-conductance mechanosensitive channel
MPIDNKGGDKMKKLLLAVAIMSLFAIPTLCDDAKTTPQQQNNSAWTQHMEQQRQENQAFRKTLKDMTPDKRKAAIDQHRAQQHQENVDFGKAQYTKNRAKLVQKLSESKKLTQSQKDSLLKAFDDNYNSTVQFTENQYQKTDAFIKKLENDTTMTQDQKKTAMKDQMKAQMEETKKFMKEQKAKLQALKKSIKATFGQDDSTPAVPATPDQ